MDSRLDGLPAKPAPEAGAGETRRSKFSVYPEDPRVSATSSVAVREIRPSVVFGNVPGGFRSAWGASVHDSYRSIASTAAIAGGAACDRLRV